jgi:hypothetical protein
MMTGNLKIRKLRDNSCGSERNHGCLWSIPSSKLTRTGRRERDVETAENAEINKVIMVESN